MGYKRIRALTRGVAVLQQLNAVECATAAAIAKGAKLPRPTVYRILDTLVEEGLIYRSPSANNVYRLTGNVRELSEGFSDDAWIAAAGDPALEALTAEIGRPANLATFGEDAMIVQASTRLRIPFWDEDLDFDQPRSMLGSALGRAYLAFCPEQERENILHRLHQRGDAECDLTYDLLPLNDMVAKARRDGYASYRSATVHEMAVPIFRATQVLGCVGVEWSAPLDEAAVAKFATALRRAQDWTQAGLPAVL
ncbi:MAG: helix-turn-helix domain-containing protein [Caulobacteraceae bacterium]|nr:helix-turn-helix domain-containing protein [Caulobacteraceae bacterium]